MSRSHKTPGRRNQLRKDRSVRQDSAKYRLEFAGRRRNNAEHVRGRRLLLQRLAQFAEQAGIFDGDDRLGSEASEQRDLFVGKGTDFLAA
jgi:hypothetical protein